MSQKVYTERPFEFRLSKRKSSLNFCVFFFSFFLRIKYLRKAERLLSCMQSVPVRVPFKSLCFHAPAPESQTPKRWTNFPPSVVIMGFKTKTKTEHQLRECIIATKQDIYMMFFAGRKKKSYLISKSSWQGENKNNIFNNRQFFQDPKPCNRREAYPLLIVTSCFKTWQKLNFEEAAHKKKMK